MPDLYQVLYCSRNVGDCDPRQLAQDVETILATSRRNNGRDQVTGGLLYSDGCFAQALEGPMEAVIAAFERIQCDIRHENIIVLHSGRIAERSFPDWSMAFAGAASHAVSDETLSHASRNGDALLTLLRSVVRRETEWLDRTDAGWNAPTLAAG